MGSQGTPIVDKRNDTHGDTSPPATPNAPQDAPRNRDWLNIADPAQRIASFLKGGTVSSVQDCLRITGSLFSETLPEESTEDPFGELFRTDESEKTSVGEPLPQHTLHLFAMVHTACLNRTCDDWFSDIVRQHQISALETGILLLLMARFCGLVPSKVQSVGQLQHLLGSTADERLAVFEALCNPGSLVQAGLLTSDEDTILVNRFMTLSHSIRTRLSGDPESEDIEAINRPWRRRQRKAQESSRFPRRSPMVSFDRLVLPQTIREQLDLATAQCTQHDRIFREWDLASVMPYGQGTTLLFSGPSGTGKTACAEAMAAAIGTSIMEVNVVQVQNKLVGECEKAIAAAFAEAQTHQAVLFWDEADGIVFNRSTLSDDRAWPVSQTTTFLKELERFSGVCILATNHHRHLDPAIDRRLSMKIRFELPDRRQRRELWQTLIPRSVPRASDLDVDAVADHPLSGGQIKNVVLNAVRRAVVRGDDARLEQADLQQALSWELQGNRGDDQQRQPAHSPHGLGVTTPPAPQYEPLIPSCRVNTKALDEDAVTALELTGVRTPLRVAQRWSGKRFLTRNGSLVQLNHVPLPRKEGGAVLVLSVLHGGHGHRPWAGYGVGSTYVVDGDGHFLVAERDQRPDDDVHTMDILSEVIDD